jgi:bifunctional polynucleotide phosphatase/kinase
MPCISSIRSDMQRQMNPESRTMLPKMAFTGFASRYREPTVDEGFDDITKVNFKVRF